jgi:AcrR family transcriptional regulator
MSEEDPRITANRSAVHRATLEILSRDGVSGLTVDRLAEQSGVSRSTIYRRWPDLAALVNSAFEEIVHEHTRTELPLRGDPSLALLDYLRDYARRLNDETYSTVLMVITEWAWRDPVFARRHAHSFDASRSMAMRLVVAGKQAGAFRGDLDVEAAVEDIVAPFVYRRLIQRRRISASEVRRLHRRLLEQFRG